MANLLVRAFAGRWSPRALCVALALSVLGNVGQGLWAAGADRVVHLTRAEIEAEIARARAAGVDSATWSVVLVQSPDLVVLEHGTMLNSRGLLGNHAQRTVYIASERGAGK